MKSIEFDTQLEGKSFLNIPQDVMARLPKAGHAKIIVLVDEDREDTHWRLAAHEQFMREDSPEDAVYDAYL